MPRWIAGSRGRSASRRRRPARRYACGSNWTASSRTAPCGSRPCPSTTPRSPAAARATTTSTRSSACWSTSSGCADGRDAGAVFGHLRAFELRRAEVDTRAVRDRAPVVRDRSPRRATARSAAVDPRDAYIVTTDQAEPYDRGQDTRSTCGAVRARRWSVRRDRHRARPTQRLHLPLVGIAAGVGGLVARAPATRAAWLLAGAAAAAVWVAISLTQTEVNGLAPPFPCRRILPTRAAPRVRLPR